MAAGDASAHAGTVLTAPTTAAPVDLGARRRAGEDAVARLAAAPVRHVTPSFLAALNCRDAERAVEGSGGARLRAVAGA